MFVVEGVKVVREFLNSSFELHQLFSVDSDFNSETVNVPFKEDVDVGINKFSSCKLQNTKDMMWEKHPKIKSWKIKKLSPGS